MKKRISYVVNADWYFQMHWLERAVAAKKFGFDVSVVTPVTDSTIKESIERNGIKVIPWNLSRSGRHVFREISSINQLRRIMDEEKPDLVHCITVKPNIYNYFLSLFIKRKLILSVTGLGMLFTSKRLIDRTLGFVVKNIYSLASMKHYIFFENNDDLNIINNTRFSNSSRLKRVMGAGVSSEEYAYQCPPELGDSLNLFFGARLLQPKGLDVLFEAVRALNEDGYNVKLRVAGIVDHDSPLAIAPKQIEEWSEYPFFEFLGNRKDIPYLIASSHFVCLPTSYGEGIPRILIEATAIGRALITTDVPGCREICTDNFNGFLVPPATSQPIVEALKGIYSDPLKLEAMCRNSNAVFQRGYDSEQVIGYTLSAYTERLAGS